MTKPIFIFGLLLLFAVSPSNAQLGKVLKGLGIDQNQGPQDDTVVSGLKEALQVGSGNAVNLTGKVDGYFHNEAIKILMPEKLKAVEKGLRMMGYAPQIDEFVLSMNRAAEKAAPFAKDIFWEAIKQMSFTDAGKILKGGDTAATDYFRQNTTEKLAAAFQPVVKESMDSLGVTRQYNELVGRYQTIPFVKSESFDINHYVVTKALNGLFHVLGEEEKKIRTNPAARVTDLLKEVFAK